MMLRSIETWETVAEIRVSERRPRPRESPYVYTVRRLLLAVALLIYGHKCTGDRIVYVPFLQRVSATLLRYQVLLY